MTQKLFPFKKNLGQHFLHDQAVIEKFIVLLSDSNLSCCDLVVEIGPGMGALTDHLVQLPIASKLLLVEIDAQLATLLRKKYSFLANRVIEADFLKWNLNDYTDGKISVVGNFPYQISSPLFWHFFTLRDRVVKIFCILQKEVAMRIASPPGSKKYGILSVLLQAFYDVKYCFSISPKAFIPIPNVESGVVYLIRNRVKSLGCNEKKFVQVVKVAFSQRRKMLRNVLKSLDTKNVLPILYCTKRAEELSVDDFIKVTNALFPVVSFDG